MPATPALVSTLSVVALALCYITLRRASLGSSSGKKIGDSSSSRRKKDLLKRRQDSNATTNGVCEGLVDLIRGQASEETEKEIGFLMSRDELSEARMVVVVIGPTSTKVYQDYVVRKLMRYLRWSNLVRKRFSISTWETCSEKDLKERQDLTPDPSSRVPTNGNHDRSVTAPDAKEGDSNHGVSTKDGLTCAREEAYKETCHRYTFSDRGKAAALTTIAVQESAKIISGWLRELKGGIAVVEAGSGWGSTRHGRQALPGLLRAAAGSDIGLLWVELLPTGLVHREHGEVVGSYRGKATWRCANGLPLMAQEPGEHVVEAFMRSGSLIGAGGHIFYESVRGGSAGGRSKECFVSLADQGTNVLSYLRHEGCPLVERVGAFAAALQMKESFHGCPVYLTRHGESLMNRNGTMGGDSLLSEDGNHFALELADFIDAQSDTSQSRLAVWCSPMKRAVQTARAVRCHRYIEWQALRELDTGIFNGCYYKQMEREFPEEFAMREKDKLSYQYPQGEGYLDVVNRLDSVVVALEKEDGPVVIISHQAVLRCLYAYFMDVPLQHVPRKQIPLHTVVKLTPDDDHLGGRWNEHRFQLMRPTPLEQLGVVVTRKSSKETSQLGEPLS